MKTQTKSKKYEGQCAACGSDITKRQAERHLDTCKKRQVSQTKHSLRLRIEDPYAKQFWLVVEATPSVTFKQLDQLLRDVWLECCGHLSSFGGYGSSVGKTRRIVEVLEPGDSLSYQYDFGSTTELSITALSLIPTSNKRPLQLVARNYPPPADCVECKANATFICTACDVDGMMPFVCEQCLSKHDEDEGEHYVLPLSNSPRSGECGYDEPMSSVLFSKKWS